MSKKALPVAGYCRLSISKDTSVSIAAQKEMLTNWAKTHSVEIRIWTDDGYSASKDVDRPGFNEMLLAIDAGECQPVIVARSIDRLGRRTKQLIDLADKYSFVTVSDGLDTRSSIGRLTMTFMAGIASYEAELIGSRQAQSQDYRRRNGKSVGSLMFGYKNEWRPDGAYKVKDEEQAAVLRMIIDRALAGDTWSSIADHLNHLGYKTARGKTWSASTVSQVTESPQIAGMRPTGDGVVLDDGGVPVVDKHLQICKVKEWERLQAMRQERAKFRTRGAKHERLLLQGIATCGTCGRRLTRAQAKVKGKIYTQYTCTADTKSNCNPRVHVSSRKLDGYIEEILKPVLDSQQVDWITHENEELLERQRLITLRMQALMESLLTASAEDRLDIVSQVNVLERERDSLDTSEKGRVEMVPTGKTYREAWKTDPRSVVDAFITGITVKPAGRGNTRAPIADRVEVTWREYDAFTMETFERFGVKLDGSMTLADLNQLMEDVRAGKVKPKPAKKTKKTAKSR